MRQNIDPLRHESQADYQYLEPPSPLASLDEAVEPFGYTMETPVDLLRSWQQGVPEILKQNHYLNSVIAEPGKTVPGFREDYATIVHGDLRHSNWIGDREWSCLSSGLGFVFV